MACNGCGFELLPSFAFCPRCGRRQPTVCLACGMPCEADFAFCPHCGATRRPAPSAGTGHREDLTAGPAPPATAKHTENRNPDADRRQVTVLFADVSGFTTLAERLDPEEVRAFQNALFEMLGEMITRYDGFVEKFVGDAVMAVFGAPLAHEDDPERALSAALDMLDGSDRLNETWARRLGQPVKLHIGVHTGPVVAGNLGNAAGAAYAVTGDTVNTTARLLAAASGTVLVSAATHALAQHRFAFEPARHLELRGKAESIIVHRLIGALAEAQSARGLTALGLASPMIGRTDELDQILAAFGRMQRGRAQVVSIAGEAGTGKSRLIAEFLDRLKTGDRLAGTAIRRAACSSLGEPTYGIFSALFREAYHVDRDDSLDVAQEKLAAGLQALGARAELAVTITPVLSYMLGVEALHNCDLDPEQLGRQIALAARTLVDRRLQEVALLFVVEDIHWADAASVGLLRDVVDHFADRRLMVLLSHRAETRPPRVARAAQSIIPLAPLSKNETRAVVTGLLRDIGNDAFAQVQEFIATRAEGNPLFVEEIVRSLVSRRYLVRQGDRWECTATCEAVEVPSTLQGLLLSRVDRIPADDRRLLQEAAVLGVEFDGRLLRSIATRTEGSEAALDRLVEADLIQQLGNGWERTRYRFKHALVHEVVYQNILVSRRIELHERVGRALETATGPQPQRLDDLEALGHHWSLSSDKTKGAHYLVAAGDWARAVYANTDAIHHYERALRTLSDCRNVAAQAQTVRERLGDLLALTGQRSEALAYYEALQAELKSADQSAVARLFRKIGALHWEAGDRHRARACFTAGLESLGQNGDTIEHAQLFQEMGRLAFRAGDNTSAISWAERALAAAGNMEGVPESTGDAVGTRVHAYNTLGVALARTGRITEAVDQIEQSIKLAEGHDLLQAACRGYTNLGVLYSSLNPRRSIETCLRGLETAKKVGDLGFESRLYANLAVAYCALTDRCEAEGIEAARKAVDLDRRLGLIDHLAVPLIVLGQIHQCHGELALALACYEEALALGEQAGEPQLMFPCYDGLATLYLDAGDHAKAEFYLAKSQQLCEQAGLDPDALMVLPFLC
jgi:adenylate cyclase